MKRGDHHGDASRSRPSASCSFGDPRALKSSVESKEIVSGLLAFLQNTNKFAATQLDGRVGKRFAPATLSAIQHPSGDQERPRAYRPKLS